MATQRKQYTAAFEAQVARAALQGDKAVGELAGQYGAHPTLTHDRKRQLLAGAERVFANGAPADTAADAEAQKAQLLEQSGRLKVELGWPKKKVGPLC